MKAFNLLFVIGALAFLVSGCASSKLTLKLDIYGEDPNIAYLTPEQLDDYERALKKAPEDIRDYAKDRKELGWHIYQVFEVSFRLSLGANPTDAEKESVTNRLKMWMAYTNELSGLTEEAVKATREAARKVRESSALIDGPGPLNDREQHRTINQQIKRSLAEVSDAIRNLTKPMTNAFEKGLIVNFDKVRTALNNKTKIAENKKEEWEKLLDEINKVRAQIRRLALKGSLSMAALAQAMDQAAEEKRMDQVARTIIAVIEGSGGPPSLATEVANRIGSLSAIDDFGFAPSDTTNVSARLTSLTPPRDHNDIEREQDPADPIWRILADSRNNSKWHTAFATNCFYSEGNNSVVVVRDTPIHYRVHSADNNPTALIEGQLRVSRALTDAAIQIAGTAAGVKMPDLKAKPPPGPAPAPAPGPATAAPKTPEAKPADETKTVSVAVAEAQIDAESAQRRATLRALQRRLTTLRADFERNVTNDITRTNLLGQFESVIKGYSALLKPEEMKPAAK